MYKMSSGEKGDVYWKTAGDVAAAYDCAFRAYYHREAIIETTNIIMITRIFYDVVTTGKRVVEKIK